MNATTSGTANRRAPAHHGKGIIYHIIILKISESPHTGYSLSKAIAEATGKRPSFGSIYPLLEQLAKEGTVTSKKDGRKKVYTITKRGKALAESFRQHHEMLFDEFARNIKMLSEITGNDKRPALELLERMRHGDRPLAPIADNAMRMRDTIFRLAHDGRLKRHGTEANRILAEAIKKMERLE